MEWKGMERNGMEWNGMEWNGMEWNGMEWNGMEWKLSKGKREIIELKYSPDVLLIMSQNVNGLLKYIHL